MQKYNSEYYWHRLDNAAKVFPAVSDVNSTNVFRVSFRLAEPVQPGPLQQAMDRTLQQLPFFAVKLRKGAFWYYFEKNLGRALVREESTYPCGRIDRFSNNGFLFRVTYYGCRLNLEMFHALGDGNGAVGLLSALTQNYYHLLYPQRVPESPLAPDDLADQALYEDSFLKWDEKAEPPVSHTAGQSYILQGVRLAPRELRVYHLALSGQALHRLAKEQGVTITVYLVALLIHSLYMASQRYSRSRRPISICVPVNLRAFFPSSTMNNFFGYINVRADYSQREYTFEELIASVRAQFEAGLTKEKLAAQIRYNVNAESMVAVRFVPLFLKNLVIKILFKRGERGQTTALSNLGRISLPEALTGLVERVDILVSPSKKKPIKVGVASLGDQLTVTFTSLIADTDVERFFCEFLSRRGVSITLTSNTKGGVPHGTL